MPTPTGQTQIQLKPENVLEIAKNTLNPIGWKCEWVMLSSSTHSPVTCSAVLGSWSACLKHLLQHAWYQWNKTRQCICHLPRCSLPREITISFEQLRDHIENSHMSRASLHCPFRGCEGGVRVFSRGTSLDDHLKEAHPDLANKVITVPSDLVLPMSVPYFPLLRDSPPPLPSHIMLGCVAVPAVRGTRIQRPSLPSASQMSQASPRKQLKLHQVADEEISSESSISFDDLEKQLVDETGEFGGKIGCILGVATRRARLDVARPQPILDPMQFGLKTPPMSIHYEVFSERFDEMDKTTIPGKVHIPVAPISAPVSSTTMH